MRINYGQLESVLASTSSLLFFFLFFPRHRPAPKDEDEMMVAIFAAIDRLLNIVRPRKVLYMAIDGVVSTMFRN